MKQTLMKNDGSIVVESIDDCRECSFFDNYLDKCKFYDDETDKCEPCKECRKDETEGEKMNIHEAIKTLDGVIPSSGNKMVDFEQMVDFEHFFIAIAWEAVKTESERLKKEVDYWKIETKVARKYIDEVRKETAEKILDEVKDMFLNTSYNIDWIFNKLEELAKQYGVEIKE